MSPLERTVALRPHSPPKHGLPLNFLRFPSVFRVKSTVKPGPTGRHSLFPLVSAFPLVSVLSFVSLWFPYGFPLLSLWFPPNSRTDLQHLIRRGGRGQALKAGELGPWWHSWASFRAKVTYTPTYLHTYTHTTPWYLRVTYIHKKCVWYVRVRETKLARGFGRIS